MAARDVGLLPAEAERYLLPRLPTIQVLAGWLAHLPRHLAPPLWPLPFCGAPVQPTCIALRCLKQYSHACCLPSALCLVPGGPS